MRDRWQVETREECSVIFVCVYRFAESEKNSTVGISEGSRLADRVKKSLEKGAVFNSSVPKSIVRFLHTLFTQKSSHIQCFLNEHPMLLIHIPSIYHRLLLGDLTKYSI
jgi:hypothetical protein